MKQKILLLFLAPLLGAAASATDYEGTLKVSTGAQTEETATEAHATWDAEQKTLLVSGFRTAGYGQVGDVSIAEVTLSETTLSATAVSVEVKLGGQTTMKTRCTLSGTLEGKTLKFSATFVNETAATATDDAAPSAAPTLKLDFEGTESQTRSLKRIADADDKGVEGIYDLTGRRIEEAPRRGVYIVRHTDGTARKIVVR